MKKNKNIIALTIMIISFFIGFYDVDAVTCTYGTGDSDNFNEWITIKITGYNEYTIADDKSTKVIPYVGGGDYLKPADDSDQDFDFYIDSFDSGTCAAYLAGWKVNLFGWEPEWDCDYETKFTYSAQLHASQEAYEISKDYCPERIRLCQQTFTDSFGKDLWESWFEDDTTDMVINYFFYKDGLTEIDAEDSSWFYEFVDDAECKDLKEISVADKEFENPISTSDCATYDEYMVVLNNDANSGGCSDNEIFTKHYRDLLELCDNYSSSTDYTEDGNAKACMTACSSIRDDISKICGYDYGTTVTENCNTFGERTLAWIFKIINMVRYLVPVILIILSVLDFIKTIASDDDGEIKKAGTRFVKRLIAAALIFIVPLILQFVLGMFNLPGLDPNNPFCVLYFI